MNKDIQEIFELFPNLERLFFKDFICEYNSPYSLNSTHIKALMMLYFNNQCPISGLSEKTNLEKGSFTPVVTKLLKLDLINKIRDENDKRVYKLFLTEKGKEIAMEVSESHESYVEDKLNQLSTTKKDEFLLCLKKINNISKEFN